MSEIRHARPDRLRLCVIGNSHTVPVRANWNQVEGLDEVDATFFCAGGRKLGRLKIENDEIVPASRDLARTLMRTSRGVGRIIPSDYDAVLVVGLQTGIKRLWGVYSSHRLADHATKRHVVISNECFDTTIDAMLSKSLAVRIFEMLAELGMRKIYLVPDPNTPEQYAVDRRLLADAQVNAFVAAAFDQGLTRMAARHGITLIRQRPETMRDGLTLANYSLAADDLAEGRETSTIRMMHGGKAFGLIVAQDVAAALSGAAA